MKKVFLSFVMMLSVAIAFGQTLSKEEIKAQKKQKKILMNLVRDAENKILDDAAGALSTLKPALESELMQEEAQMWLVTAKAKRAIVDAESNKRLAKEAYNANLLNTYAYEIFDDLNRCYELDNKPNEKGKVAPKFTDEIKTLAANCHYHVYNGGGDYFREKNYTEAGKYFARLADLNEYEYMKDLINNEQDASIILHAAYNATICGMQAQDYDMVLRYVDTFKNDSERAELHYDHKIRALKAKEDTVAWLETLKEAVKAFPVNETFQNNLIKYYNDKDMHNELIVFMDEMIASNPSSEYFYFVKGVVYNKLEDIEPAIECYKKAIEINPNHIESLGNLARCYISKASDYSNNQASTKLSNKAQLKKDKEIIQGYYREALPLLEKLRELEPDNTSLWLNGLANCYYNLNMNKQFDELNHLLESEN